MPIKLASQLVYIANTENILRIEIDTHLCRL